MRILHTADWHLGKQLKGVDRTPEIIGALQEIAALVQSERIDLVVVSGDLFDRAQVSTEAEIAAINFFLRLREMGVAAEVIAGNHDSVQRLSVLAPLLALAGVSLEAAPLVGPEAVGLRPGLTVGRVPFISDRRLVRAAQLLSESSEAWRGRYADGMRRIFASLGAPNGLPGILLAHLTVEKAQMGGGEFAFYTGEHFAVPASAFPTCWSYCALGHIHRQQQVGEAPVAWYSGSLIQLDFGEGENAPRGALIVELEPGEVPRVHPVDAHWGKALRTFRAGPENLEQVLTQVERFAGYAKVVVAGRGNPVLRERILALPGVIALEFEAEVLESDPVTLPERLDWGELYQEYLRERGEVARSSELSQVFRQVYEESRAPAET